MTSRIRILDDTLVDQIAAGEVVERPASAVKELLENSVDAGASRIDLEIEDGGKSCLRVSDDGVGMSPEDAALAIRRHATSKIRSFDDLVRVRSLGFRGEALPSIASVSRLSLRTRPHEETVGTEVRVEGGGEPRIRPAGGAAGTTIEIRDLFFNVPARRKFLKATHAEAARIHDVFIRLALAHPEIRFSYRSGGREIRALSPSVGLPGRAAAIFQHEALEEIVHAERGLRFEAMLRAGAAAKQTSRQLYLFVNGRAVLDPALVRAIAHGLGSDLPPGRFPVGVVHLHLPPEEVDVNVHPQKTEVRLAHAHERQRQIQEIVARSRASRVDGSGPVSRSLGYWEERLGAGRSTATSSVRDAAPPRDRWGVGAALRGSPEPPNPPDPAPNPPDPAPNPPDPVPAPNPPDPNPPAPNPPAPNPPAPNPPAPNPPAPASAPNPPDPAPNPPDPFRSLQYLGRAHHHHLICESTEGLAVLDGRRGAALVARASLTGAFREHGAVTARRLVFPPRLDVADAPGLADREGPRLARLGFEVSPLSEGTLAIHTAPEAVASLPPTEALSLVLAARDDAEALDALAEAASRRANLDEEDVRAIVHLAEHLEVLPRGFVRTVRLDAEEEAT